MINGGVDTEGGFVGLDHGVGHLGSVVDAEIQLGVLAQVEVFSDSVEDQINDLLAHNQNLNF